MHEEKEESIVEIQGYLYNVSMCIHARVSDKKGNERETESDVVVILQSPSNNQ